jgi:hypothetical protein
MLVANLSSAHLIHFSHALLNLKVEVDKFEVLIYLFIIYFFLILSECSYLFNLIGPLIGCPALLDQCCSILSALLISYKKHLSADITSMLGEQLQVYMVSLFTMFSIHLISYSIIYNLSFVQFLVSKLVACCIPSERKESRDSFVSKGLPLLHKFTLKSDPSMHDYVKVSFGYSTFLFCFKDLILLCFMDK